MQPGPCVGTVLAFRFSAVQFLVEINSWLQIKSPCLPDASSTCSLFFFFFCLRMLIGHLDLTCSEFMSLSFSRFPFVFLLSICENSFFFVISFSFGCAGILLLCRLSLVAGSGDYSLAAAQKLCHTGLVAPRHVGSSRIRDRTRVSCADRQILHH